MAINKNVTGQRNQVDFLVQRNNPLFDCVVKCNACPFFRLTYGIAYILFLLSNSSNVLSVSFAMLGISNPANVFEYLLSRRVPIAHAW
ncbi:hypothetical protein L228DRAFT_245599 [Xylona heveae TC161]|uniref:Uncharacterized protein n=1 Tax=Xylona heveae (strain CBS 132557 / TC161) TaxID=1328760 RepID=A0A165IAG3_XYLHT|nr:hypothetical protein L228DRAFT_245599 [Xylona heveae TC161]KZF24622.1 hypothetical protein L228DRAFT_245599 [Xylona heveae TC161]